jgi:hypothetical protein
VHGDPEGNEVVSADRDYRFGSSVFTTTRRQLLGVNS